MIVQYDSELRTDGHVVGGAITLVYGTEYELRLTVHDWDMTPFDAEALGCTFWKVSVVASLGTAEKELAGCMMFENIADGASLNIYGLSASTVEAYKFVAGRLRVPAIMCVYGYIDKDDPTAVFRLHLPIALQSSSAALHPVDLSSALLARLQIATAKATAFGTAATSAAARACGCADTACDAAARAEDAASSAAQDFDWLLTLFERICWRDVDASDSASASQP